jgi:uncharacterized membrane protein
LGIISNIPLSSIAAWGIIALLVAVFPTHCVHVSKSKKQEWVTCLGFTSNAAATIANVWAYQYTIFCNYF